MLEIQDHYFHLAKKQWYVARSAFKLQEIDEKFKFFDRNVRTVIDIGCAPGSWLQYTSRKLQATSHKPQNKNTWDLQLTAWSLQPLIIWFDLKPVEINLPFTKTFVQDITEQDKVIEILNSQFWILNNDTNNLEFNIQHSTSQVDVIISDMAPDTVGDKATDALRSSWLIMETMRMYEELLKPEGKFAIKVFMWPWFDDLVQYCRERRWASHIKIFKPKSCRKESKETYIVKM